jgi:uncharacterized OB-fold protein
MWIHFDSIVEQVGEVWTYTKMTYLRSQQDLLAPFFVAVID